MKTVLENELVLTLYCLLKQAERSMPPGLCPGQWSLLQQYYDADTRMLIGQTLAEVKTHVRRECAVHCSEFSTFGLGWILTYPVRWIANRYRHNWAFRENEVYFLAETLRSFLDGLAATSEPANAELYRLKVDLYVSSWVIERRLVGLPFLRLASKVEHFCPSKPHECVKLPDLLRTTRNLGNSVNEEDRLECDRERQGQATGAK